MMNFDLMTHVFDIRKFVILLLVITAVACQNTPAKQTTPAVVTPPPTATPMVMPTETAVVVNTKEATTPTDTEDLLETNDIPPHMLVVYEFLDALQQGLTSADSGKYLSQDLQAAVIDGRPLPTIVGIRDLFPSYSLTDISDNSLISGAIIRATFNFDVPTYALFRVVQEEDEWRIKNIAQHNLVQTASTRDLLMAEAAIIKYYQALANNEIDIALNLLTGEAQETFSADALAPVATGLRQITVTTMQPVRATEDQINFYVRLFATPNEDQPGPWQTGDNPRWLTLTRHDEGWRIARIINSPILADVKTWQRVNILPIDMTLDVPSDWTRPNLEWAWSPNSLGMPAIGVNWTDLGEFGDDEALLPRRRQEINQRPINLGWAEGTQYNFQQVGGVGEGPINAESHIIVRTDRRAYDFYAIANTIEELDNMRPILQRMVAAVVIHDPEAVAYNSIETSSNFLATLLRDATGQSSLPYLSESLQADGVDYQSLLDLLGIDAIYRNFQASWLENNSDGQAKIKVTLFLTDDETATRLFTLDRDDTGDWHIITIEDAAD